MPKTIKALIHCPCEAQQDYIGQILARSVHCVVQLIAESQFSQLKQRLNRQRFDVVIVATDNDNTLLESLRWLRGEQYTSAPAIIAIAGRDAPPIYQQCLQFGANDCVPMDQLTPTLLERSILHAISQQRSEEHLLKLVHFDPLTGLPNRKQFKHFLEGFLQQSKRSDQQFALLLIDLDNFGAVNDLLGYGAGDELLIQVAERLANSVRDSDHVARLSGDEFAILATQIESNADAATLAKSILKVCCFPLESALNDLVVTSSMGIALYPRDGRNSQQLLTRANAALRQSSDQGGSCFHYADPDLNRAHRQQELLCDDMGQAILRNQLRLYVQPIVTLDDYRVNGVEILLRWQHPRQGLLTPDTFLATAESSGLIKLLGNWVLDQTCRLHGEWIKQGLPSIPVSINLSLSQLGNSSMVHLISDQRRLQGFDLRNLTIELREGQIYNCDVATTERLQELQDLGVRIAMDNFGTGFSSLSQLQRLPIDCIKIDRSLIQDLSQNPEHAEIASAIIQLCEVMHFDVIAQGVEDDSTLRFLDREKCGKFQGYCIAAPLAAEDFPLWYQSYNDNRNHMALH